MKTTIMPGLVWLMTTLMPLFAQDTKPFLEIVQFKAEGGVSQGEVKDGDTVKFICDVRGHPTPDVTLSILGKQMQTPVSMEVSGVTRKSIHKLVGCLDTGVYTCLATNSYGSTSEDFVLAVRCPVKNLSTPRKKNDVFVVTDDSTLDIKLDYEGFPPPSVVIVKKVSSPDDGTQSAWKTEILVDENLYMHRLAKGVSTKASPKGSIILTLLTVASWDMSLYVVEVKNGFTDGSDYRFRLVGGTQNENCHASTTHPEDNTLSQESCNEGLHVGVIVACDVIICIIAFVVGFFIGTKRASRKLTTRPQSTQQEMQSSPSPRYDHITRRSTMVKPTYAQVIGDGDKHRNEKEVNKKTNRERQKLPIPESGDQDETFRKEVTGVSTEGNPREDSGNIYMEPSADSGADQDGYEEPDEIFMDS